MQDIAWKLCLFGYRRIGVLLGRKGMIMNHRKLSAVSRGRDLGQTGKPRQNAFIETFNGRLLDERLNDEILYKSRKKRLLPLARDLCQGAATDVVAFYFITRRSSYGSKPVAATMEDSGGGATWEITPSRQGRLIPAR